MKGSLGLVIGSLLRVERQMRADSLAGSYQMLSSPEWRLNLTALRFGWTLEEATRQLRAVLSPRAFARFAPSHVQG